MTQFPTPQELGAVSKADQAAIDRQEQLRQKVMQRLTYPDPNGNRSLELSRHFTHTDIQVIIGELKAATWIATMREDVRNVCWLDIEPQDRLSLRPPTPDELDAASEAQAQAEAKPLIEQIIAKMAGKSSDEKIVINVRRDISKLVLEIIRGRMHGWNVAHQKDQRESQLIITKSGSPAS